MRAVERMGFMTFMLNKNAIRCGLHVGTGEG